MPLRGEQSNELNCFPRPFKPEYNVIVPDPPFWTITSCFPSSEALMVGFSWASLSTFFKDLRALVRLSGQWPFVALLPFKHTVLTCQWGDKDKDSHLFHLSLERNGGKKTIRGLNDLLYVRRTLLLAFRLGWHFSPVSLQSCKRTCLTVVLKIHFHLWTKPLLGVFCSHSASSENKGTIWVTR